MQEVKKFSLVPLAKVTALFGVILGFIQGILMTINSVIYARNGFSLTLSEAMSYIVEDPGIGFSPILIALGWWNIILLPIAIGIVYFVSGIIMGWIYNLVSNWIGGIKVELSEPRKNETKKSKKK
jgi:hypothetical protein